ncbi:hypothetical protein FFLO_06992 [Filobasidium floriforme]|uniref:Proline dehydrogenase n=1 Tax=Filobasidium floriforme TaxID=5210 RepID=A0A8K0JDT8_9TREE|nr:hypothetical protein FFLO_06992 [Filobasidium floriforme]
MSLVRPLFGHRIPRTGRYIPKTLSQQARHLSNNHNHNKNTDAPLPLSNARLRSSRSRGHKAGIYVASTILASLGWLAWDASAYPQESRSEHPDVLLQSMKFGDLVKSYLAFSYLSIPPIFESDENSVLAPITRRLTALATSHQFGTGETLQEVFDLAISLNEKHGIGALISFPSPAPLVASTSSGSSSPPNQDQDRDRNAEQESEAQEEIRRARATAYKDEIFRVVDLARDYKHEHEHESERRSGPGSGNLRKEGRLGIMFRFSGLLPDPEVLVRRSERLTEERDKALSSSSVSSSSSSLSSSPLQESRQSTSDLKVREGDWERLWSIDQSNGWQNIREAFVLDDAYEAVRELIQKSKTIGLDVYIDREDRDHTGDAGYKDKQSSVDVLVDRLMSEFNKSEAGLPVVHVALRASSAVDGRKIVGQMERAEEAGYSLGLKLDKEDGITDQRFDGPDEYRTIVHRVLQTMQKRQVAKSAVHTAIKPLFVTHDQDSIDRIRDDLAQMQRPDKNRIAALVSVGQEFGHRDDMSSKLLHAVKADEMAQVIKVLMRKGTAGYIGQWGKVHGVERSRLASEIFQRISPV